MVMTSPGILAVLRVTFPRLHATHEWAGTLEYIALHNKVKADFASHHGTMIRPDRTLAAAPLNAFAIALS
jgi:hypothetical protein